MTCCCSGLHWTVYKLCANRISPTTLKICSYYHSFVHVCFQRGTRKKEKGPTTLMHDAHRVMVGAEEERESLKRGEEDKRKRVSDNNIHSFPASMGIQRPQKLHLKWMLKLEKGINTKKHISKQWIVAANTWHNCGCGIVDYGFKEGS